jgi:hypothetical protein
MLKAITELHTTLSLAAEASTAMSRFFLETSLYLT